MELKIRLKRIVFVFLVVAGLLLGFYWIFLFRFSLIFSFEFLFFLVDVVRVLFFGFCS